MSIEEGRSFMGEGAANVPTVWSKIFWVNQIHLCFAFHFRNQDLHRHAKIQIW